MSKHNKKCTCKECGRDLYTDDNILAECKRATDACVSSVIPENLGRPMYVVIIGDEGLCVSNSPMFSGGDDILIDCLESVIEQLKEVPRIVETD